MVPQDLFYKMAVLALVAIILLSLLSFKAFALDGGYEEYMDSGPVGEQGGSLSSDVAAIRQMMELVLYFAIPFAFAVMLVYKFCMWFYYTFIRTVL